MRRECNKRTERWPHTHRVMTTRTERGPHMFKGNKALRCTHLCAGSVGPLGDLSDDEGGGGARVLNVRTGVMDEKYTATAALAAYADSCPHALAPHMEVSSRRWAGSRAHANSIASINCNLQRERRLTH
eukprot:350895-Chlamydomonas_euryale.AAC.1